MRVKLFLAIIGFMVFGSWMAPKSNDIKKAYWLIGSWEYKTSDKNTYETWIKINKDELSGKSYALNGKDTIVFETIRLVQEQDSLFYIPTVKNQNSNLPVRFGMRSVSKTKLVFENPGHDFPKVISYVKINADSLVAEISGLKNGLERKHTFPMKRVNKN